MIDPTITLGNMIEIGSIAIGGLAVFFKQNSNIGFMKKEITEMGAEIKKLADIITSVALADLRLTRAENDIYELKHGVGFIQTSIDGEYNREGKIRHK